SHVHPEMGSGRLEIRRLALGHLMDMQRVIPRRQVLDIQLDAYAVRRFGERGNSHALSVDVLELHDDRLACGRRIRLRHPTAQNQYADTHQTRDQSHCAHPLLGSVLSRFPRNASFFTLPMRSPRRYTLWLSRY